MFRDRLLKKWPEKSIFWVPLVVIPVLQNALVLCRLCTPSPIKWNLMYRTIKCSKAIRPSSHDRAKVPNLILTPTASVNDNLADSVLKISVERYWPLPSHSMFKNSERLVTPSHGTTFWSLPEIWPSKAASCIQVLPNRTNVRDGSCYFA